VPLSLVIALMGGGSWMTNLHSKTDANTVTLARTIDTQREFLTHIIQVKQELAEIKGELKRIKRY